MSEEAPMPARTPISVFVRCRPLNNRERESCGDSEHCITMDGDRVIVADTTRAETLDQKFTGCFWSVEGGDGQDVVYDAVGAPLVTQALKGFDATLLAYGVTGAGKSTSIRGREGPGPGLRPRAMEALFREKPAGVEIEMACFEVYNEAVSDRNPNRDMNEGRQGLQVRQHPGRERFYVDGLAWTRVYDSDAVQEFEDRALAESAINMTMMNQSSHRSHFFVQVRLLNEAAAVGDDESKGAPTLSTLTFGDLSGSERGASVNGSRMREGTLINKSLFAFKNVMASLAKGQRASFRTSVVTKLLAGPLSDGITSIIVAVSPAPSEFDNAIDSLKFGQNALKVLCSPRSSLDPRVNPDISRTKPPEPVRITTAGNVVVVEDAAVGGTAEGLEAARSRQLVRHEARADAEKALRLEQQRAFTAVAGLTAANAAKRYATLRADGLDRPTQRRWRRACDAEMVIISELFSKVLREANHLDTQERDGDVNVAKAPQVVGAYLDAANKDVMAYLGLPTDSVLDTTLFSEISATHRGPSQGCRAKRQPKLSRPAGKVTAAEALVLKMTRWRGPSPVFGHSKYDACHVALERSGADVNELCRLGIELQRALGQFEASLKSFLFNESGIGWDADKLRNPKRHTGGAELVAQFESMQQNEAAALCRFTAAASDQAYASVKGSTMGKALPKLSVDAPHLASDVQPLPAIFQGMVYSDNVKFAELEPADQDVIHSAVELVLGHVPGTAPEVVAAIADPSQQPLISLIKGGRLGDDTEHIHVNPSDPAPAWLVRECSPTLGAGLIAPQAYLYAQMLLLSSEFHRDMQQLLAKHGRYYPARMKGFLRAWSKCADPADGYGGESHSRPETKHLKDVLRCTLLVENHHQLVTAHTALIKAYQPAGTKDRRNEAPKDVLQLVWFQNYIVEVQFHFAPVAAIKKLSHVAYNIMRVNPEAGFGDGLETLFCFDDMWAVDAEVCTPDDLTMRLQLC